MRRIELIVLQEPLRALFYAPFYAAIGRDAFVQEGVAVRLVSSPHPDAALDALLDGTADVGWGGPMRVNLAYHIDPAGDFKCFAEVVTRDPFFLVTREPRSPFRLPALLDLRLGTVSEVPTPWLCLQHDLRLAGLDPAAVARVADRSMAENAASLLRGEIDVAQVFQPYVEELLEQGCHIWYAAAERGLCTYTTLYARAAVLAAKQSQMQAMVRGLAATLGWVARAEPAMLADAIEPFFPEIPPARMAAACARYQALGVWGETPVLPRAGYDRLLSSLVSSGFVDPGTPFDQAVDNSLADAAVRAPAVLCPIER